jgi:hypothetical protein
MMTRVRDDGKRRCVKWTEKYKHGISRKRSKCAVWSVECLLHSEAALICVVTPCSRVEPYQSFVGTFLDVQGV